MAQNDNKDFFKQYEVNDNDEYFNQFQAAETQLETAPETYNPVTTAALNVADSATLGFADEIEGAARAAAAKALGADEKLADLYEQYKHVAKNRLEQASEQNRKSAMLGQIGGAFVPGLGALGVAGKAAKGASWLQKAAAAGKAGAAAGAIAGAGYSEAPIASSEFVEDVVKGGALGGGLGVAGSSLASAAGKGAQLAQKTQLGEDITRAFELGKDKVSVLGRGYLDKVTGKVIEAEKGIRGTLFQKLDDNFEAKMEALKNSGAPGVDFSGLYDDTVAQVNKAVENNRISQAEADSFISNLQKKFYKELPDVQKGARTVKTGVAQEVVPAAPSSEEQLAGLIPEMRAKSQAVREAADFSVANQDVDGQKFTQLLKRVKNPATGEDLINVEKQLPFSSAVPESTVSKPTREVTQKLKQGYKIGETPAEVFTDAEGRTIEIFDAIKEGQKRGQISVEEATQLVRDLQHAGFEKTMSDPAKANLLKDLARKASDVVENVAPEAIQPLNKESAAVYNLLEQLGDIDPKKKEEASNALLRMIQNADAELRPVSTSERQQFLATLKKALPEKAEEIEKKIMATGEEFAFAKRLENGETISPGWFKQLTGNLKGVAVKGANVLGQVKTAAPQVPSSVNTKLVPWMRNQAVRVSATPNDDRAHEFSQKLYTASDDEISQMIPQIQSKKPELAARLQKALADKDSATKNAILFTIAQDPNLRGSVK